MKFKFFMFFMVLLFILTNVRVFSQTYSGPAFGTIAGGDSISTIDVEGVAAPIVNVKKIFNPYWEKFDLPLVDDKLNKTAPMAPLGSNFQTDLSAVNSKFSQ